MPEDTMNTLQAQWERLYRATATTQPLPDTPDAGLLAPDGSVRALVLELARPAHWDTLSVLWRGVQTELELPAPAIAVNGVDGYQLWFSLARAVAAPQARDFLQALCLRYLPAVEAPRVRLLPGLHGALTQHAHPVPMLHADTGRWSAFVAPDLAAIFSDEPWLDVSPSTEAQSGVLCRLACITPDAFDTARRRLQPTAPAAVSADNVARTAAQQDQQDLEPRRFLQDVLNDPGIALQLRIEAAKALLR